jgi:hypothetical protein
MTKQYFPNRLSFFSIYSSIQSMDSIVGFFAPLRLYVRLLLASVFFIAFASSLFSQNLSPQSRRTPLTTDLFNGMPIARPASNVLGDINFNEEWRLTIATLYDEDKKIEGYFAKYNIYAYELDFNTQGGIKALKGDRIKTFTINDSISRTFVNAKDFKKNGVPLVGFLEVLVSGEVSLYKFHYLLIKHPDYNPALNAGSRDTRIYKKSDLFTASRNKLIEIKNKKKLLLFFGDNAKQVDEFIRANHLSMNEEKDVVKTFTFFNSLKKVP